MTGEKWKTDIDDFLFFPFQSAGDIMVYTIILSCHLVTNLKKQEER